MLCVGHNAPFWPAVAWCSCCFHLLGGPKHASGWNVCRIVSVLTQRIAAICSNVSPPACQRLKVALSLLCQHSGNNLIPAPLTNKEAIIVVVSAPLWGAVADADKKTMITPYLHLTMAPFVHCHKISNMSFLVDDNHLFSGSSCAVMQPGEQHSVKYLVIKVQPDQARMTGCAGGQLQQNAPGNGDLLQTPYQVTHLAVGCAHIVAPT